MVNGAAKTLGISNEKLPFPKLSAPTTRSTDIEEYMGFSYCLPCTDDVSNPVEPANIGIEFPEEEEEDVIEQEATNLAAIEDMEEALGDDFDVEVLLTETGYLQPGPAELRHINQELLRLEEDSLADANDCLNSEVIQQELRKLLPMTTGKESTLEAFKRLTDKSPWFPLRSPDSTTVATDLDKAEAAYFEAKSKEYSIHVDHDAPNGYKAFAREWNNEVSRRFKAWSSGDDVAVQMRLKKWEYLVDYYEKIQGHEALQATTVADGNRQRLNDVLKRNRRQLPTRQQAFVVTPPMYRHDGTTPFAAPAVLNSIITVNAVTGGNYAATGLIDGRMVVPYQVRRPILMLPPPPKRQRVFRSRMFCITCGWRRNLHVANEGVAETCRRNFCGKCYKLKDHHLLDVNGKLMFGKDCVNPVNDFCSIYVDEWYTVSSLVTVVTSIKQIGDVH
ncbi:MAG: hypothetical protein ACRCZI_11755 [Cetobacterium sp.]